MQSFLRFTVGATSPVTRARLRVYVTDLSANGPEVYPTVTGWTEDGITWKNRPVRTGGLLADSGAISAVGYLEWDLGTPAPVNGVYSFNVAADSDDATGFNATESGSSTQPELILEF